MSGFVRVPDTYADDIVVVMGKPAEDGWTEPHWAVELFNMNAHSLVLSRHATQEEADRQAADVLSMLSDLLTQDDG